MSETTNLLPKFYEPFPRNEAERNEMINRSIMGSGQNYNIDRHSATWLAVKSFINKQVKVDYLPALRKKGMDHGQTEYARGAMDALDSLLQFGGEEV